MKKNSYKKIWPRNFLPVFRACQEHCANTSIGLEPDAPGEILAWSGQPGQKWHAVVL